MEKNKFILNFLLIIAVAAIVIVALNVADIDDQQDRFTVSATGKVFAKPDIANLTVGFKTETKDTAAEAVEENSEKMNKIIATLKKLDIEEKDIKTTNYNLNPVYNWTQDEGQVLKGYEVTQNVTIKIRDLDNIGKAIAKSTEQGANQVGSISFTIDDEDELKAEARDEAIEKAKVKAKDMAKKAGMKLGKIVNVYENQVYYPETRYINDMIFGKGGGGEIEAPSIEVGENEVSVEVSITYKIK